MSMDFVTVLDSQSNNLVTALTSVNEALVKGLSMSRGNTISREDLEDQSPEEQILHSASISEIANQLQNWKGCSLDYWTTNLEVNNFNVNLIVSVSQTNTLTIFISTDVRALRRLVEAKQINYYFSLLTAIANAVNATCGFGNVELNIEPIKPEDIITALSKNNCPLGIISKKFMEESQVQALTNGNMDLKDDSDYWLLEQKDFSV